MWLPPDLHGSQWRSRMLGVRQKPSHTPRYLPIDRKQFFLEPLDVDRLIDDDHPARKIWSVAEQLDLSRFASEVRAVAGVAGRPSHSPQVLVAVWVYAFSKGLHSAREIARSRGRCAMSRAYVG